MMIARERSEKEGGERKKHVLHLHSCWKHSLTRNICLNSIANDSQSVYFSAVVHFSVLKQEGEDRIDDCFGDLIPIRLKGTCLPLCLTSQQSADMTDCYSSFHCQAVCSFNHASDGFKCINFFFCTICTVVMASIRAFISLPVFASSFHFFPLFLFLSPVTRQFSQVCVLRVKTHILVQLNITHHPESAFQSVPVGIPMTRKGTSGRTLLTPFSRHLILPKR